MGRRALTTDKFVKRARDVHGDRYDYSLVKYVNARTNVQIICSEHGVFEQRPDHHLNGSGCLECVVEPYRLTIKGFVQRAREIHDDKYDYSLVEYVNNKSLVKIICPEHGVFKQRPDGHLYQKQGCPLCAIEHLSKQQTSTTDEFIKCAREVHGDRYDYSMVMYVNNYTHVMIICPKHGMFMQIPNNHISRKAGCPQCAETGFNPSEPGILYVLADDKRCPTLLKIGITNDLKQRIRQLRHTTPHPVVKLAGYTFSHGVDAYKLEQDVHKVFSEFNAGMNGFNGATEWFKYSHAILDYIRDTIRLFKTY